MNKRTLLKRSWLIAAAILAACNGLPVQLGSEPGVKYESSQPRQISAEACGFQLLLFIPIATNTRALKAYRALRIQAGEDYITDVKVTESWIYAFVGTVYCTGLEATAYPRSKT